MLMGLIVVTVGDIVQLSLLSLFIVGFLCCAVYATIYQRIKFYFCKRKLRKSNDLANLNPTDDV